MRTTHLLACLALAGCYGEGAPPGTPGNITVLLYANDPGAPSCGNQHYISSVAYLLADGYAITSPYMATGNNCNGGGGGGAGGTNLVYMFDKQMGNGFTETSSVTTMGGGDNHPRIGRSGHYVYIDSSDGALTIGPDNFKAPLSSSGQVEPVGFVDDITGFWIAGVVGPTTGVVEIENPNFPCCGTAGTPQGNYFAVIQADGTGGRMLPFTIAQPLAVDMVKDSFVGNSDNLFLMTMDYTGGTTARLWQWPKSGTQQSELVQVDSTEIGPEHAPMGIAADDAHLVWSVSNLYRTGDTPHFCQVYSRDLATNTTTKLLDTTSFSCLDVALDDTSAYIVIADLEYPPDQSPGTFVVHGRGLGRFGFDGSMATLDLKITGLGRGPRRVLVDAKHIYAIDPDVLAQIPKTVLDTPLDFVP
jgi:hypothetical protein